MKVAVENPLLVALTVIVFAVVGSVYVEDAMPLLPVTATGVPNVPPAPPSLKVTLTPAVAVPLVVANTLKEVGKVVPTLPLWLLPPLTASVLVVAVEVSVNEAAA